MLKSVNQFSRNPSSARLNGSLPVVETPLGVYYTTTDYWSDRAVGYEKDGRVTIETKDGADQIVLCGAAYRSGDILLFRKMLKNDRRILRHFLYVARNLNTLNQYAEAYAHALQIKAEISTREAMQEVRFG